MAASDERSPPDEAVAEVGDPTSGGPPPREVAALARGALRAWAAQAGSLLWLAVGAALLANGWTMFAGWHRFERLPERLTARATGEVEEAYWLVEGATEGPGVEPGQWAWYAQATLHATVGFRDRQGRSVRVGFASPASLPFTGFAPGPDPLLTPALGLRWVDPASGLPKGEVRFRRDQLVRLRATPTTTPRTTWWGPEEVRTPESELDEIWEEVDRPLELLARSWATSPAASVAMAYDPERPEEALPVSALTAGRGAERRSNDLVLLAALGGFGLLAWCVGIGVLSRGVPVWVVLPVAALPLLLPLWSDGFWRTLRWLLPADAERFVVEMGSGLDYARNAGVLLAGAPLPTGDHVAQVWRYEASHHAPLLAHFTLQQPDPAPADAEAAWAAIAEQLTAQALARDEDGQRELLMALMEDLRTERMGLGLVFVEAAHRMSLDPARSANLHEWATAYLQRLLSRSSLPWPGGRQVGRQALRATLLRLAGHPDGEIRARAQAMVTENDAAWAADIASRR